MKTMHIAAAATILLTGPAVSLADNCRLSIEANDNMQFNTRQLSVPASCGTVELRLKHVGHLPAATMGHNWVLALTRDSAAVAAAGTAAGLAKGYLPARDPRVIAATSLIGGGQETSVSFSTAGLKSGEDYSFFCSAPGHIAMMKGKFLFGK